MDSIINAFNMRLNMALTSVDDRDFYMNVYHYFDYIHRTEILKNIFDESEKEYSIKFYDIWKEKRQYSEEELDIKSAFVDKLEKFNLYAVGCTMFVRIYLPIDDYKNTDDPDTHQDPVAIILVRGMKYATNLKRRSRKNLELHNRWFDGHRKDYERDLRRFHIMFLDELAKPLPAHIKPKISFDKDKSALKIDDKSVIIKLKNDKPNSHYVLEYIFENDEGLKAQSFYTDILKSKFLNERKDWRSMYRACGDINTKVSKQAQISNFLSIKAGKTGYVQINPEYL